MSECPGIFHDIGKKARDLLYKDYTQQPPVHYNYRCLDWSFDLSCQINEVPPGLRTAFRFIIPYQNKVELQYLHDYAGITAGVSTLGAKPLLNFSAVVGNSYVATGTDLSFDVEARKLSKCNAGLSFNSGILVGSFTLNDMGDTFRASCHATVSHLTNSAIAAELTHKFSRNENTLTFGTQHAVFPVTLVKARVSSNGKLGSLIQQQLLPSIFLTIAGDVDVRDLTNSARLGLSLAVRP